MHFSPCFWPQNRANFCTWNFLDYFMPDIWQNLVKRMTKFAEICRTYSISTNRFTHTLALKCCDDVCSVALEEQEDQHFKKYLRYNCSILIISKNLYSCISRVCTFCCILHFSSRSGEKANLTNTKWMVCVRFFVPIWNGYGGTTHQLEPTLNNHYSNLMLASEHREYGPEL